MIRRTSALLLLPLLLWGAGQLPSPSSVLGAMASEPSGSRGLRLLEDMETAITELAERVRPSVVNIALCPCRLDRRNSFAILEAQGPA